MIKTKGFIGLLLGIFLLSVAGGMWLESAIDEPSALGETKNKSDTLLWKVKGDAGTAWLFGSVHALRKSDLPLDKEVIQAYKKADVVLMELDTDDLDKAKMQQITMQLGLLQDGKTLKGIMEPAAFKQLEDAATKAQLPMAAVNRFEPWLAAIMLQALKMKQLGFSETNAPEAVITSLAVKDKKPVEGLETVAFQLHVFDDLSMDTKQVFLKNTLKNLGKTKQELNRIVSAWHAGDVDEIAKLADELQAKNPLLYSQLLVERNKNWVDKLGTHLDTKDETLIVVVGALHLAGDDSVISMLKEKGYSIVRQ